MTFPESVEHDARQRARGTCECTLNNCPHFGRCRVRGAEFHHKKSRIDGGGDELRNCLFVCKACHQRIHSSSGGLGLL